MNNTWGMIKKVLQTLYPIFLLILFSCNLENDEPSDRSEVIKLDLSGLFSSQSRVTLLLTNGSKDDTTLPTISSNTTYTRSTDPTTYSATPFRVDKESRSLTKDYDIDKSRSLDTTRDYTVGDVESFVMLTDLVPFTYSWVDLTLEHKGEISDSEYTLYIWLDRTDSDNQGDFTAAVDHLAEQSNGIFSDMIDVYGDPWGERSISPDNLISSERRDIHIFLIDIAGDGGAFNTASEGTIYGYFDSFDLYNFETDEVTTPAIETPNRCLNLVIDSYLYLTPTIEWSANNSSTIYGVSTLIHELQHMIHYYQKSIIQGQNMGTNESVFINEMFSMIAEDLLASSYLGNDTVGYLPPDLIRMPDFNTGWDVQGSYLWLDNLQSYANAYALGAYILRNYSIDLIKSYLNSERNGIDGLITTLQYFNSPNLTRKKLLENFGRAVLNSYSSETEFPYIFNRPVLQSSEEYYLFAFNLFSETYYPSSTFSTYPLDLYQSKLDRTFNGESNYYIDLGILQSSSEVELSFPDGLDSVSYSLVF